MSKRDQNDLHETSQARTAARLAAAQALYQIEAAGGSPDAVMKDFLMGRVGSVAIAGEDGAESVVRLAELDSELFVGIIRCFQARGDEIDTMIKHAVSADWPWERLEMTVRAILRAGVAELLSRTDITANITVNEFIDLAHAFYEGAEPRMVNAVLDKIARALGRLGQPASETSR